MTLSFYLVQNNLSASHFVSHSLTIGYIVFFIYINLLLLTSH